MTRIYYESDANLAALEGERIAVVGYGNQGRSWALNLRDSGCAPSVHVRADASRDQARADGFDVQEVAAAEDADVICLLVPDDVISQLPITPSADSLVVVASGYVLAFDRLAPAGDAGIVAPRMLGPEVRRCYQEGAGFISAVGVHRDATGRAWERLLAVARAIGGLRQGAIELSPRQEAVLDLAVEQLLSPALTHVSQAFVSTLLAEGIPLEAILTELALSGEVERNYRLLREIGFVRQLDLHSPASQYGQLARRGAFDHLDVAATMRALLDEITSGRFAEEWEAESAAGHSRLKKLREVHAGPALAEFEAALRRRLGPDAARAAGAASEPAAAEQG